MPCTNCNEQPISFTYSYPSGCGDSSTCTCTYTGNSLVCSGILSGDTLNQALEKIDAQICSIAGDYSSYNFNCLTTWLGSSITTEAEFVAAITEYTCEIRTDLDTFTDTTFPAYQDAVDDRFVAIEQPEITCVSAGVTSVDSLQTVLTKYCTKFGTIDTALNISTVDWDQCFTVLSPPTTLAGAFDLLIDQICIVKASVPAEITFDNTGNCLAGGATDSLTTTIDEIINKLCFAPIWNTNDDDIEYGCIPKVYTSGGANLLQNVVNNILYSTNALLATNVVNWSGDFIVTESNPGFPCDGLDIALATPINQDRKVATSATDNTPGELIDKLAEGSNITITEIGSNPNKQIEISATIDHKILASNTDDTPGFLIDKVNGDTSEGITLTPTYNVGTKKVDFDLSVDMDTLVASVLSKIASDETLKGVFCSIVNTCIPQACVQYTVTNSSGVTQQITYTDCSSAEVGPLFLNTGNSLTFCALLNSVTASGCTIINDGECTTTSTTTVTVDGQNVVVNNNSTDVVISAVDVNGGGVLFDIITGSLPNSTGETVVADVNVGTYAFTFTVSSASTGQSISVTDSLTNYQCIEVTGAGVYTLYGVVVDNNTACVFTVNSTNCIV